MYLVASGHVRGASASGDAVMQITDSSGTMSGTLQFPLIGGKIATEGFGIALAVALG